MASSLGESFCSRILDVGRAGGRASEPVCGCARRDRTMVPWGNMVRLGKWYFNNWFSTARKIECEGQGSSCSLGCVRFGDDEKP